MNWSLITDELGLEAVVSAEEERAGELLEEDHAGWRTGSLRMVRGCCSMSSSSTLGLMRFCLILAAVFERDTRLMEEYQSWKV